MKGGIQGRDVRKPRDAVTMHPSLERNSFCEDVSTHSYFILMASKGIGRPWDGVGNGGARWRARPAFSVRR